MEPSSYRNGRHSHASIGPTAADFFAALPSALKPVSYDETRELQRAPLPTRNHGMPCDNDGFPWVRRPRGHWLRSRHYSRHLGITA
jgi:hypothetical protein